MYASQRTTHIYKYPEIPDKNAFLAFTRKKGLLVYFDIPNDAKVTLNLEVITNRSTYIPRFIHLFTLFK